MFVLNVAIMPFLNEITNIYSLSSETAALAKQILILHGINCCISWSLSFNIPNALRACADVKYTLIVSAASMWIVRIGASFVLGKFMGMGLFGVWAAMILDWYVRAIFYVFRLKGGKWQKQALIN